MKCKKCTHYELKLLDKYNASIDNPSSWQKRCNVNQNPDNCNCVKSYTKLTTAILILLAVFIFGIMHVSGAEPTYSLRPDSTAGFDGQMREILPNTNFGTDTLITQGFNAPDRFWSFIKFDVDAVIAKTDTIDSVRIGYKVDGAINGDNSVLAYHLSKRIMVEEETTWNEYSSGNSWQTAGAMGVPDIYEGVDETDSTNQRSGLADGGVQWIIATNVTRLVAGVDSVYINNGFTLQSTVNSGTNFSDYGSSHTKRGATYRPVMEIYIRGAAAVTEQTGIQSSPLNGTIKSSNPNGTIKSSPSYP